MSVLRFFNRQKTRPLNLGLLRKISRTLIIELLEIKSFELAVHLVDTPEMTRLNEAFLQHEGSTDVITFDNSEPNTEGGLTGEIFISINDAIDYAKQFRTTWQSEAVRYVVHGVLHLQGYDDLEPGLRRVMKREENRLVKTLAEKFDFSELSKKTRP